MASIRCTVGVFCGVRYGVDPAYRDVARQFGRRVAERGLGLVFGGSGIGMMGAVSAAAAARGAPVTGVMPRHLFVRECADVTISDLRIVETMHERKALMYQLADSFVALPGGLGTLDELFEVSTWAQLGLHRKAVVVLNHCGYFDPLVEMLDRAVDDGFLSPQDRRLVSQAATVDDSLDLVMEHPQAHLRVTVSG